MKLAGQLVVSVLVAVAATPFITAEVITGSEDREDFCAWNPCGDGNTCVSTPVGYKCFCRPGDDREDCRKEEQCMLFNNTGICREQCHDDETGFVLSNIGRKFMNIMVYLKNQTAPLQERVPIVDIKEQMPCMWQMSGKPDCCIPTDEVNIGCFAYGGLVRTENRGLIAVEKVKTGDRVESVTADGDRHFSDVVMIMHQEPDRKEEMVSIEGQRTQNVLTLTHDHLVGVSDDGENWSYVFSEKVRPGQYIRVVGEDDFTTLDRVSSVSRSARTGLYAPVTISGNIVVDGISASCYGNHPDHFLSHMVFAPVRWTYRWMPWLYNGDAVSDDGSHPYVSFLNRYLRQLTGYSLVLSQHRLDGITNFS